jgi:hypothetical protein
MANCSGHLVIVQWCCSFIDRWGQEGSSSLSTLGPNPFGEIEN